MSAEILAVILLLTAPLISASTSCKQRAAQDFRADDNDCAIFHICSMGQLITLSCTAGSVFDEVTGGCVPVLSAYDTCSARMAAKQRCPPGTVGVVAHPTNCAQYYACGTAEEGNRLGWEQQLRECQYPMVFSDIEKTCVQLAPGVCGSRQEPLDQCDYKENQCEGRSHCVPCNIRFPSCRGLPDGLNAWSGREGSPYYVTCQQQRPTSWAKCKQEGGVVIFHPQLRQCVPQDPNQSVQPALQSPVQLTVAPPLSIQASLPQGQNNAFQLISFLGYQSNQSSQLPGTTSKLQLQV